MNLIVNIIIFFFSSLRFYLFSCSFYCNKNQITNNNNNFYSYLNIDWECINCKSKNWQERRIYRGCNCLWHLCANLMLFCAHSRNLWSILSVLRKLCVCVWAFAVYELLAMPSWRSIFTAASRSSLVFFAICWTFSISVECDRLNIGKQQHARHLRLNVWNQMKYTQYCSTAAKG